MEDVSKFLGGAAPAADGEGPAPVLRLHPAARGSFVATLEVADHASGAASKKKLKVERQMVIIHDNSGSMGQWSQRMVNATYPVMLREMGYMNDDYVLLICL